MLQPTESNSIPKECLTAVTGWTDYAWSSDNLAASQSAQSYEAAGSSGEGRARRWQTVIENIGIPVGRPQTVTVDLTGKFLSASREVRIVTNMRILWDQILVDTFAKHSPVKTDTARSCPRCFTLARVFTRSYS